MQNSNNQEQVHNETHKALISYYIHCIISSIIKNQIITESIAKLLSCWKKEITDFLKQHFLILSLNLLLELMDRPNSSIAERPVSFRRSYQVNQGVFPYVKVSCTILERCEMWLPWLSLISLSLRILHQTKLTLWYLTIDDYWHSHRSWCLVINCPTFTQAYT